MKISDWGLVEPRQNPWAAWEQGRMRHPQIVIRDPDGWVARQLRDAAADHRWLIREPHSAAETCTLACEARPTVLLVQVDPQDDAGTALALIGDVQRRAPGVPIVAVSETKLPDAERITWTAALFDLGARFVLFPPLAKSVLEDAVTGLLAAAIRREMQPSHS